MAKPYDFSKFRKSITKSIEGLSEGFRDPKHWISSGNYALNYLISGDFYKGVPLGKVTVFAGESGCLPADATVTVHTDTERIVTIRELKSLFFGEDPLQISTPDGYVSISEWYDKGVMETVKITTESNLSTICATNHLLQRPDGEWIPADQVVAGDELITINSDSDIVIKVENSGKMECFDFTVDHPNQRYWGDGFSSHNSGKSYICSGNIIKNAQEQGIFVVLIDTENALDEEWLHRLGVNTDPEKMIKFNMAMIDDVAKVISEFMKEYKTIDEDQRPKVLFVIDSLGMLLTPTDAAQFSSGDLKGDMGRKPKALKALVSNCVNMFGSYDVGLVATNHIYGSQDPYNPDPIISGGCLTAGHKVMMCDKSYRSIEDISVGDVVSTMNGDIAVIKTFEFHDKEVFKLSLDNGTAIEATGEHKFLVENPDGSTSWKMVSELSENDEIIAVD